MEILQKRDIAEYLCLLPASLDTVFHHSPRMDRRKASWWAAPQLCDP